MIDVETTYDMADAEAIFWSIPHSKFVCHESIVGSPLHENASRIQAIAQSAIFIKLFEGLTQKEAETYDLTTENLADPNITYVIFTTAHEDSSVASKPTLRLGFSDSVPSITFGLIPDNSREKKSMLVPKRLTFSIINNELILERENLDPEDDFMFVNLVVDYLAESPEKFNVIVRTSTV